MFKLNEGRRSTKKMRPAFRALSRFLILALPCFPAQQNPAQKIPRHDAAAVVKLVPVRVLDQNGRPVMDLKKENFVLYDNKELKTITEFEIHRLEESGRMPKKTETTLGPTPIREMNRKYFIFLDVQGSDFTGIANAKKAALHFVETKLQPGDEVAVLYYAPMTGLNMEEYLTSDKQKIRKAIERAKEAPPLPGDTLVVGDSEGGGEKPFGYGGSMTVQIPGEAVFGRSRGDFNLNFSELAKAMQYIPGTKNLVFFTERGADKRIAREFAASNTPVFVVNTHNWTYTGNMPAQKAAEQPLKEFAAASGGQYFADIKDVQTIADNIQTLSGNYYVLGYYINEQWDGRYHEIKVEVKRPECRVFVQGGYNNPKPYAELSDLEKQLHFFDLMYGDRPASRSAPDIPVEGLFCLDGKGANSVILAKMPVDEKRGIPPGKAELFMFIFDQDRKVVRSGRAVIDLTPHDQKVFYPYSAASLNPGEYELRFVARDMTTGQAAAGTSILNIPKPELSGMKFYSPLLLIPGHDPQFLRLIPAKGGAEPPPSLRNFYPLFPMRCSPLVKVLESETKKILAVLPVEFQADQTPDVDLDVFLASPSSGGRDLLVANLLDSKAIGNNKVVLVLEINLPDLRPGDYDLEITATESEKRVQKVLKTSFVKR
jgi:VWFA-related protein